MSALSATPVTTTAAVLVELEKLRRQVRKLVDSDRVKRIRVMREGLRLNRMDIAKVEGVSAERVRQILRAEGIS